MKKNVVLILALVAAVSFAGVVEPFKQFTQADYTDCTKPGQAWWLADMFTLSVSGGNDVWLSNHVRSWYEPIPDLHGNVYDMDGDQKYGYIFKEDLTSATLANGSYGDKIHWANSETTTITYTNDNGPASKPSFRWSSLHGYNIWRVPHEKNKISMIQFIAKQTNQIHRRSL